MQKGVYFLLNLLKMFLKVFTVKMSLRDMLGKRNRQD